MEAQVLRMNEENKMENQAAACVGMSMAHHGMCKYETGMGKFEGVVSQVMPVRGCGHAGNRRRYGHTSYRKSVMAHIFEPSRRVHVSRLSHVEAYMRWSLTRDMIRACSNAEFYIFTAVSSGIHVLQAWFAGDSLMTSCWYFSADCSWKTILNEVCAHENAGKHAYFFTPGNAIRCQCSDIHPVRCLTRRHILQYSPNATVIHLDSLAHSAVQCSHRYIGADARCWLERLTAGGISPACRDLHDIEEDYLVSAICADLAVIIRLMHRPAHAAVGVQGGKAV